MGLVKIAAWVLIIAGFAAALAAHWAHPLDPEDDPDCPDELDDYGDCEFPTWLEGDAA